MQEIQPLKYDLLDSAIILVIGDWSTLLGRVASLRPLTEAETIVDSRQPNIITN